MHLPVQVEALLDTVDGISVVHSHFYLLASDLYKVQVMQEGSELSLMSWEGL